MRIKINEKISVDVPPAQEVPDQVLASFAQYLLPKIQDYYASQAERRELCGQAAQEGTA